MKLPKLKMPNVVKEVGKKLLSFLSITGKALGIATIIASVFGSIIYGLAVFFTASLVPPAMVLLTVRGICVILFLVVFATVFKEISSDNDRD